ncbi:MAG: hypothetical protein JW804_02665 [Sedimentisphaerales bacterium]|nr:hypothetical protein [Sedimentisphaerales bacterium]
MKRTGKKTTDRQNGSVLVLVLISIIILTASGVGLLTVSYGVRHQAIKTRNEVVAMLSAEAGYERAVFRMSQQADLLSAISTGQFTTSEDLTFIKPDEPGYEGDEDEETGTAGYVISLDSFIGSRPVYKIESTGQCGVFERTVKTYVIQAISGWDMGMCRIPTGTTSTAPVYYVSGEIIDMPIHINSYSDPYDSDRDIHISGSPDFQREVTMSESRYSSEEADKYSSVMYLFDEGIYFLQPSSKITDPDVMQNKVDAFKTTLQDQKPQYIFTPTKNGSVTNGMAAVQLEFWVESGVGKVRITNDCTVRGYRNNNNTLDYRIDRSYESLRFEKYYVYGYHYIPQNAESIGKRITTDVTETYVVPQYGGVQGEPGGQIFVDGNVVIGGKKTNHSGSQVVKGRITVAATGNIWIADDITLDGSHDADGKPSEDNPNVLGLVAQGVIKVVDPGIINDELSGPSPVSGAEYEPIGLTDGGGDDSYPRKLARYTTIEASITVSGGGWGAENVDAGYSHNGRKDQSGQDYLVVRGTIAEAVRGVVGSGSDGYVKRYYLDERLLEGILPGDIWLKGKFIPAPAGWHDYRSDI